MYLIFLSNGIFLNRVSNFDIYFFQWVTFVMLVQAGTFMLPYKIWTGLEGGLIAEFGLDAKSGILLKENYGEGLVMESLVDKYVKFFKSVLHRNNYYFFKYVTCEVLNLVVLFFNFYLTDVFLNGNFWYYGLEFLKFTRLTHAEQVTQCAILPIFSLINRLFWG